jgi:hypothetical protein
VGTQVLGGSPCPRHVSAFRPHTRGMGVRAVLMVRGQPVTLADPSGGTFDAAGDFDRLLPVPAESFPVLGRIDPFGKTVIPGEDLAAVAREAGQLLGQVAEGPERRGLLRLRALATAGQDDPAAQVCFLGD